MVNQESKTGRYVTLAGGGTAFVPNPLPPDPPFDVDAEMWRLLSQADRALGRLDGASEILPNPDLFVAMYVRKEAVLSSQIEGTQASLTDLLEYEVKKPTLKGLLDVGEVVNYVAAMNYGQEEMRKRPLSLELLKDLHAKLLAGVRGGELSRGEFRKTQNWLGPEESRITDATYVPPPPEEVGPAMAALEQFILHPGALPPLLKTALAHAQFETIHPFLDGNGRIGRLLIILLLSADGVIRQPLLYLSYFLKRNRAEYYDRLQATRSPGSWEGWLKFFIRGVTETADEAATTAKRVVTLREEHRGLVQKQLGRRAAEGLAVLDRLYLNPVTDVRAMAASLGKTYLYANRLVAELVKLGLLKEVTGQYRNRRFTYADYLALFEQPTEPKAGT